MLIHQLSKETGITAHTIRYYEKYGLIRGKRDDAQKSNNYYHYDDETVYKLELIRDAKAAGFTLNEIKQLIDAWYDKEFSVEKKLAILDEKLLSIDEKIEQLLEVKKVIAALKEDVIKDDCWKKEPSVNMSAIILIIQLLNARCHQYFGIAWQNKR